MRDKVANFVRQIQVDVVGMGSNECRCEIRVLLALVPFRAIYSHAVSRYEWKLDETWKQFHTRCALGNDHFGTVEFVVKVDGKECWRSGLVYNDRSSQCDLRIEQAKSLKLIVTDGGDGTSLDHGFWIDPTIRR